MSLKEQIKAQRAALEKLVADAKAQHAANEEKAKTGALTQEEANALRALMDDGALKRADLDRLIKLDEADDFLHAPAGNGAKAQEAPTGAKLQTWGDRVVHGPEYKGLAAQGTRIQDLPRIDVGSFDAWVGRKGRQRKAIYEALATAGGGLVVPDFRTDILDIARQVPIVVLDLVNRTTTQSDLVEYMEMDTRTSAAAEVTEYSGGFGLKPESNRTFALLTAAVRTIAAWVGASRQILMDVPRLRAFIDNDLTYEVEIKLETTLIADILAWSGIQSRVHAVSGSRFDAADNIADTLRRAITDIYLAFYAPDGIVLNPAQGEGMELLKDDNNNYLHVYDSATMRVWRVPVVESASMTAGSALVAAFKLGVTVWDREQTQVLTGQPSDYFLRNAWAILAELRFADAVVRPLAVEKITGLP